MAIWHPGRFWRDIEGCPVEGPDGPELMEWPALMVNPTGIYPSQTPVGQLDAGCYWWDPKLLVQCWAPFFYNCLSCCCTPQKCGIPDEVVMTLNGFSGTLTSIDPTTDYGYGSSAIVDCSQFYQKNGGGNDADYYCFVQPAHTVKPVWHTSPGCCNRYRDAYSWWPRDSYRGSDSTGADLCTLDRAICDVFPSLCVSTPQPISYGGKTPPRWIPTCEPCCGWGWFYWENPTARTGKKTIVGAADCTGYGTSFEDWYKLFEEFKINDLDTNTIYDTLKFRYRDPVWAAIERDSHLWPSGYCGFTAQNLVPLDSTFWNEWHIDTQGWPRSPFYENCWGGFWSPAFWDTFLDPRTAYAQWCTSVANFKPTKDTPVNWTYSRPEIVLISQPSVGNCWPCWGRFINLLNGSGDGHCSGTCNVNMQDFNRTVVLRSALSLQSPQFRISVNRTRTKPVNESRLLDVELLYHVSAVTTPWSFEVDYPCDPQFYWDGCDCWICNLNPGIVQPRLKAFYKGESGYGAKIEFAIRIYCGPTALLEAYGPIFNGSWWYVDDVWIGEADKDFPAPRGAGYSVGDRFYFDYYEDPLRGGESYWPTERGVYFQECRVAAVSAAGEILKLELVLHVPRLADGATPEYPEAGQEEQEFNPTGLESNTVTTKVKLHKIDITQTLKAKPVLERMNVEEPPTPPVLVANNDPVDFWSYEEFVILAPDIEIQASDYTQVTSATVTLTDAQPGDELFLGEFFFIAGISGQWHPDDKEFRFTGAGTRDQYEAALRGLKYRFIGADFTLADTRDELTFSWKVAARDFKQDGVGPIILNLGCGRFFRNYRPPLYGRVLNHRLSVAVPGNGYREGDILKWEPVNMPPSGQIATGNKWYPYYNATSSVRRFAKATVVEVDSRGGVVDWHMCGAENQLWFNDYVYSPDDANHVGFWPTGFTSEWYADKYDYACHGEINTGDYYDIAYANKCDYLYVGYIPIRYSWSGLISSLERGGGGMCDHTYAEMFFAVDQVSVKTSISVIPPLKPNGRQAKLKLIGVDENMLYPPPDFTTSLNPCKITPVCYHNWEEAPSWSAQVDAYSQESCTHFYKRHPIPVPQGSVTLSTHIAIIDPGSGYVYSDGSFPEMSTMNGFISIDNVCDDMRAYLGAIYGFPGRCQFRVSSFTEDGGIASIEIIWPGYWYFAHDYDDVWLHTVGSNWFFEMAWPTTSDHPLQEDPSPDCRFELSGDQVCCHATRDNWGALHHFDGFPEPYPSSMFRYTNNRYVRDPEAEPWENNPRVFRTEYAWYECGFGSNGVFPTAQNYLTSDPGNALCGDSTKRWGTEFCPDIGGTWKMILVHPCAACAKDQGLEGGQTCFNPCGWGNSTYSTNWGYPVSTGVGFWGIGVGGSYDWRGTGQAWISRLAGELTCTVDFDRTQIPPLGTPGDI
jgi:hypothetical protein